MVTQSGNLWAPCACNGTDLTLFLPDLTEVNSFFDASRCTLQSVVVGELGIVYVDGSRRGGTSLEI